MTLCALVVSKIELLHAAVVDASKMQDKLNWHLIAHRVCPTGGLKDHECFLKYMQLRRAKEHAAKEIVEPQRGRRWSAAEVGLT